MKPYLLAILIFLALAGCSGTDDDAPEAQQNVCLYTELQVCLPIQSSECPGNGILVLKCPYSSSSGSSSPSIATSSSSAEGATSSSGESNSSSSIGSAALSSSAEGATSSSDESNSSSSIGSAALSSSSSGSSGELMNCLISSYCYDIPDAAECSKYGGAPSPCEKMAGCGSYCKWSTSGCVEIVPDPAAVYGTRTIANCAAAILNCSSYASGGPYSNSSCAIIAPSSSSRESQLQTSSFTDPRDSQIYKTAKIGTQVWMAENLNYNVENSSCYSNLAVNCATYGRLYNWAMAMSFTASCNTNGCASQIKAKHKGICPDGWHIPNTSDWEILMTYVQTDNGSTYTSGSNASIAGKYLKATNSWNSYEGVSGNGQDIYGFAALPGGYKDEFLFTDISKIGRWWSSDIKDNVNQTRVAYGLSMSYGYEGTGWTDHYKYLMVSVRCLQD
jgi:uncharacterized protein (TIGR02145 family)